VHDYPRTGVTFVPVTDAEPAVVSLAWRAGAVSPAVKAFIEASRQVAALKPGAESNNDATRQPRV
jgi:hypothetical protein